MQGTLQHPPVLNQIFKVEKIYKPKPLAALMDLDNIDLYLRMNAQTWMNSEFDRFDLFDFDSNYHYKNKTGSRAATIDVTINAEGESASLASDEDGN